MGCWFVSVGALRPPHPAHPAGWRFLLKCRSSKTSIDRMGYQERVLEVVGSRHCGFC